MMTKIQKEKYYKYIINCIDSEAYDIKTKSTKDKLQFLSDTFHKEYGWNIERIGQYMAFQEWTQGLPSVFHIEFYNYKIIELAKKIGTLDKNATEKQEDRILENYWNFITILTFQLFRKYKIN